MSQTPKSKNVKGVQTPGTGGKSSKNAAKDDSQPQSASSGRLAKGKSFTSVVKMYVPKTPRGSETPSASNANADPGSPGSQGGFSSPTALKTTNVTLSKPKNKKKKNNSGRMVLQKIYQSKSIDVNKEEAKKEGEDDENQKEEEQEIEGRATVGGRIEDEEEEDDNGLQHRHSLPAHLTCPTEFGVRGTESPDKSTGNYEFKDEAEDENDVIRLEGKESQKEGRTSHLEQGKEQNEGEENIISSPLNVPDHKVNEEEQDQVIEEPADKKEVEVNVQEEKQTVQGDIVKQETEHQKTEENEQAGERLNTISEEHHEEEAHHKEIPETQVSETTSRAETASTPANETFVSRNEDAQETFKERAGSSGIDTQVHSRVQKEVPKKRGFIPPEPEFIEKEVKEVEIQRKTEEAPKKSRNVHHHRHEGDEPVKVKTETPVETKTPSHPEDLAENRTRGNTETRNADLDIKKEMQRQSEQKKMQEDLATKLDHAEIREIKDEEKLRKGREGCCQAGCNMF